MQLQFFLFHWKCNCVSADNVFVFCYRRRSRNTSKKISHRQHIACRVTEIFGQGWGRGRAKLLVAVSRTVCTHIGGPENSGDAEARPLEGGVADPIETRSVPTTVSNLVVLGQSIRAYVRYANYANSLIHRSINVRRLQCVQNSAARVVLRDHPHQSTTALLSELDWLPVQSRITFKIACLTYKVLTTGQPY